MNGKARKIRIYLGEADKWRGRPMYQAILEMLRRDGLPGATVLRGIAGFGKGSVIHTASILRLSEDLPMVVEVVAEPAQAEQLLDKLSTMGVEGLITVEDVEVYHYGV